MALEPEVIEKAGGRVATVLDEDGIRRIDRLDASQSARLAVVLVIGVGGQDESTVAFRVPDELSAATIEIVIAVLVPESLPLPMVEIAE